MNAPQITAARKRKKITKSKPTTPNLTSGRPTLYNKDYCEQARKLALLGLTDEQMIDVFQIAPRTFYVWKQKHIEFRTAINAGRMIADAEVANALYKRATGNFIIHETKVALHKGKFVKTTIEKEFEPDAHAAQFWLQKRQASLWKDKIEVDINTFPDKQTLDALYEQIMQQAGQQQAQVAQRSEKGWLNAQS